MGFVAFIIALLFILGIIALIGGAILFAIWVAKTTFHIALKIGLFAFTFGLFVTLMVMFIFISTLFFGFLFVPF